MPVIEFKAKIRPVYNVDGTLAWQDIKVPAIKRSHCDIDAFRRSEKYRSYANSDLFTSMIARALKAAGVKEFIRLDQVPACVNIDSSGFLAKVSIEV